jgi:hypothetical protein
MHIQPDSLPIGHDGIMPRLQKGPTIHSSAWVVPGATVLGDVILEEESSVWYGAVLRGDINRIMIGPRSNVQDNAVVHVDTNYPTTVGELVTVGHTAIVHACKIDSEMLAAWAQLFSTTSKSVRVPSSAQTRWSRWGPKSRPAHWCSARPQKFADN